MVKVVNISKEKFAEEIKEKKIICFGGGKKFAEFTSQYPDTGKVKCIVDNYKSGSKININNYTIPVVSIDTLVINDEDIVVITSLRFAKEIIQQMDSTIKFAGKRVYIYELIINEYNSTKINLNTGKPEKIPKKIHYCWFGNARMPKQFQDNIDTWKRYCPDYEIIKWNEDNYDITKNPYMKEAYNEKKWGFVPDYARVDIIYTHGGIYLDTDVELLRTLDELLSYEFFCGFENINYVNFGQGFGANKGNKILKEMIKDYETLSFINDDGTLNLVASPVYQTRVMKKFGLKPNAELQFIKDGIILSPEFLGPINLLGIGNPTINSFSIHQYAATWHNDEQKEDKERLVEVYKYVINRMRKDNQQVEIQ